MFSKTNADNCYYRPFCNRTFRANLAWHDFISSYSNTNLSEDTEDNFKQLTRLSLLCTQCLCMTFEPTPEKQRERARAWYKEFSWLHDSTWWCTANMVLCVVFGCSKRQGRDKDVSFYRIPKIMEKLSRKNMLGFYQR